MAEDEGKVLSLKELKKVNEAEEAAEEESQEEPVEEQEEGAGAVLGADTYRCRGREPLGSQTVRQPRQA